MANAENRPFSGTWTYNNKKVRRHVPDAIITFNGETSMPSCTGCTGSIDFQDLITSVSVSNSTDTSPSSVSFGMELPTNRRSCFFRDNKFILHPGIEVHVYMRGYFTHSELGGSTEDPNYNLNAATLKPYYQVFNGVITEVTHGYSGGFYSVSLSATDFLHFWQYQSINTNPSYLGSKVDGNKTNINFTGHAYTRKNPFSVVHELYSSGHGDAGGHSWVLSDFQNIGIKSDLFQASFWEITGYYWQKRFQQPMGNLKMYGTDGRLFNSFEQFLLSSDLIGSGEAKKSSDKWDALGSKESDTVIGGQKIDNYMDSLLTVLRHSNSKDGQVDKQKYAFPSSSLFYVDNTTWGVDSAKGTGKRGYNVAGVTAFALDISSLGQVNLFESQMQTKMDIASQVSTEIGYEFFIDFNGDYVFKPPFYNMDTSGSRIYTILDIDLISFSANEKEAECTVMKGTGGYFNNMASLFGKEFENRGMFVDWRGVAKYGWRESSFETTFLNDPRSIYYAAMNRLALANKDVQSGSVSIPLRPEMKLGFPVYIEPFDVFYYVTGISHNFSYGGDCTTDLTLTAKRAKFFPPMEKQGRFPKLQDIDFKNIYRPNHALFTKNGQGQPKYMGFPCVILASDPNEVNPLWFGLGEITNFLLNLPANTAGKSVGGNNYEGLITLVRSLADRSTRLTYGLNPKGSERKHMVFVRDANNGNEIGIRFEQILEGAKLLKQRIEDRIGEKTWTQYEKNGDGSFADVEFLSSLATSKKTKKYAAGLQQFFLILDEVRAEHGGFVEAGTNMENYLASLKYMKSNFRPDDQQPGMYRYYSSAFPNDESVSKTFQGMGDRQTVNVESLTTGGLVAKTVTLTHEIETPEPVVKVVDKGDGTYDIVDPNNPDHAEKVKAAGGTSAFLGKYGIPVRSFIYTNQKKGATQNKYTYNVIPTEAIKSMCFAVQFLGYKKPLKLDILSGVKFNSGAKNYSVLLPYYKNDPHPTGVTCKEVYDPFIEAHLKAFRDIGGDFYNTLKSFGQDTRADAWQKVMDKLEGKYTKIQGKNRYKSSPFNRSNRWVFKSYFWSLAKAMTNDMVQLTKYFNIVETLKAAKDGKLSAFFNSDEVSVDASAKIPSGLSFYGKATSNLADILDEDIKAMADIMNTVTYALHLERADPVPDNAPPVESTYEYQLLKAWVNNPVEKGASTVRKGDLYNAMVDNTFSYLYLSYVDQVTGGTYVTRAAKSEPFYSPVFPVSDEAGFEVFGHYAYGRGMTLKSLAEIIDTPTELWAGLSPLDLNRLYGAIGSRSYKKRNGKYALTTNFGDYDSTQAEDLKHERLEQIYGGFDNNYRTTLNESMASYITQRGVGNVLSQDIIDHMNNAGVDLNSSDDVLKYLTTWTTTGAGTETTQGSGVDGIELAAMIFEQAFVGNILTSNQQYGQKISAANVPIELARLDQFYSPTTCNGGAANALSTSDAFMVESDQYSFAFNSSTGDFNETAYQQMLAENKIMDWFTHQEALRGEIQEETITLASLEEDYNAIGDAFSTLSSDIQSVPDVFGQMVLGLPSQQEAVSSLPPPTINEEDE